MKGDSFAFFARCPFCAPSFLMLVSSIVVLFCIVHKQMGQSRSAAQTESMCVDDAVSSMGSVPPSALISQNVPPSLAAPVGSLGPQVRLFGASYLVLH